MKTAFTSNDVVPRKRPSQSRSAETVSFILEAAEHILDEHGLDGFNTNVVAERAGVSVGSVYQYYPRKEAIIAALIYRMHEKILMALTDWTIETRSLPVEQALEHLARSSIKLHRERPNLIRILELEEEKLPRTVELKAIEEEILDAMIGFISPHLDCVQGGDVPLHMIATDMLNIVRVMTVPTDETSDHWIANRVTWALCGYLEKWTLPMVAPNA